MINWLESERCILSIKLPSVLRSIFQEQAMCEIVGSMEKKKLWSASSLWPFTKQVPSCLFLEKKAVERCGAAIAQFLAMIQKGHLLRMPDFEQFSRLMAREPNVDLVKMQKSVWKRLFTLSLAYYEAMKKMILFLGLVPQEQEKHILQWRWHWTLCTKKKYEKLFCVDLRLKQGETWFAPWYDG